MAVVLTAAAGGRTESRGGHVRRDFPASQDRWLHRVTVELDAGGEVVLGEEAL